MAEWFKAPVLKTGVGQLTVGSNPSLSAAKAALFIEQPFRVLKSRWRIEQRGRCRV